MKHFISNLGICVTSLVLYTSEALPNNPSFSSTAFTPKQSNLPNYSNPNANANANVPTTENDPQSPSPSMQQQGLSFEERTAAWRQQQQQFKNSQTPLQEASSTDEQGRLKLLANVSKGSVSFFFFILMWRSVHHFEMADVSFQGLARTVFVLPTVALFLGNMMGCVAAFSPVNQKMKRRLKVVLNANKSMEIVMFLYHVFRLSIYPSKTVIREVYVGRILSNFVFLLQCQLYTKVTWDGLKVSEYVSSETSEYTPAPIYDDYNQPGVYDGYERFESNDYYERSENYQPYQTGDAPSQQQYNRGWE